jgi:hypothetical protein
MTLPALPLFIENINLADHQSLKLALCWLRGGSVLDYLALEVSDSVLISMVLQAARDFNSTSREINLQQASFSGWAEGYKKGLEIGAL